MLNMAPPFAVLSVLATSASLVAGHACLWHEAMWGFNVTGDMFPYDNRQVDPLMGLTFDRWWFHGHLDYPPEEGKFMELPAGGVFNGEITCDKGASSYYTSNPGGDIRDGTVCPGQPSTAFHANDEANTRGCALGIAYKSDVNDVKPEDFVIFSTNHTCVWNRWTDFAVPADMPACPEGGCICSFNWIHAPDSGAEQIYMNGYRCKVTGSTSTRKLATPRLARRCMGGPMDFDNVPAPWNCTYGAKQALYWLQAERNTFFEGNHAPPFYNDLYGFTNGAQEDIFDDSDLPVFDEKGEMIGVTTLGGSTATVVNVVQPTIDGGWPTTAPGFASAPTIIASSSSSPPSSSSTSSSATLTGNAKSSSGAETSPSATETQTATSTGALAENIVESSQISVTPTSSPASTIIHNDANPASPSSEDKDVPSSTFVASGGGPTSQCRSRNNTQKRNVALKRNSKRAFSVQHKRRHHADAGFF